MTEEETAIQQLQKAAECSAHHDSEPEFMQEQTTRAKAFIEVMTSCASSLTFKHAENQYKEEEDSSLVKSAFKELYTADENAFDSCYEAYTSSVITRRYEVGI